MDAHKKDPEIVASAWSPRFAAAVADVLRSEGGFVDDPADRGGATNFGISLRFLVAEGRIDLDADTRVDFDLDGDGDIDGQDIRRLTRGDAKYLYHRCFWRRIDADGLPRPIGEMLFDQGVNAGRSGAIRAFQRAVNRCLARAASAPPSIKVDGRIGARTIAAMNWIIHWGSLGMAALVDAFRAEVRLRYRDIAARNPSQKRFLKGWLARADRLGRI